jgi:preprotein translocase SecF subunit
MFIVKNKIIFIGLAIALVLGSLFSINRYGIKKGIDFTGGAVVEIAVATSTVFGIDLDSFEEKGIKAYKIGDYQYKFISPLSYEEIKREVYPALNGLSFVETQVNVVGPTLGKEMTKKAAIAIIVVVLSILAFIAFAFREVSYPVASWKYGVAAMVTIVHDIIIPTGVYAYLSHMYGAEIDTLFIVALLTIMAVTISDKIVVFDRIRENLKTAKGTFEEIIGVSLRQTAVRSINTSLTTVLALIALYIWGPETTKFFSLTLMVGLVVGTYSSIFVASPLLTYLKGKK